MNTILYQLLLLRPLLLRLFSLLRSAIAAAVGSVVQGHAGRVRGHRKRDSRENASERAEENALMTHQLFTSAHTDRAINNDGKSSLADSRCGEEKRFQK